MEQYLRFRPLRSAIDRFGGRLLVLTLCTGWFVFLWGLGMPAVLAGFSLHLMVLLALRKGSAQAAQKREEALRRRLGAEIAMEELMLAPPRQAHFRAGLMLAEKYPLTMDRITDSGLFCHDDQGSMLVCCFCCPPQCAVSPAALLEMIRTAKEQHIGRCIACATAPFSKESSAFAEVSPIPVQLFDRNRLLPLAGRLSPATDVQLAALAKRRKQTSVRSAASHALDRMKAKRYMTCGVSLACVYILTGLKWYALPALLCMLLSAVCRTRRSMPEHL